MTNPQFKVIIGSPETREELELKFETLSSRIRMLRSQLSYMERTIQPEGFINRYTQGLRDIIVFLESDIHRLKAAILYDGDTEEMEEIEWLNEKAKREGNATNER